MKKIIKMKISVFFVLCILVLSFSLTYAIDYKTDGTPHPSGISPNGLGTEVSIDNNQYNIKGGTSKQGNLFHSFDQFNLHTGESAIFHDTGHSNTFARISGGNYSWINGKITSYADNLFLLNPNGWMFGENASIDVSGSFHVNTADYIKFSDGNQFHADVSKNSILTIESLEAFGFINDQSGSIVFENSKLSLNKTVSIIGNGIELIDSEIKNTVGFINVCSVSSEGEATLSNSDSKMSLAFNKKGMLSIRENSAIGYNKIFISGSDVTLQDKSLLGSLTIDENGNEIIIDSKNMLFENGSQAIIKNEGIGQSGKLLIKSDIIQLKNKCLISSSTYSNGSNDGIYFQANEVIIEDGSKISTLTQGNGNAGKISIHSNTLKFVRNSSDMPSTGIVSGNSGQIQGGDIDIQANELFLENGVTILSVTDAVGKGGNISIKSNIVKMFTSLSNIAGGKIISLTLDDVEKAGNAGNIDIEAKELIMDNGSQIRNQTNGTGQGGSIDLDISESLTMSGFNDKDNASSAIVASTKSTNVNAGNAGNVTIKTVDLLLKHGAMIQSHSVGCGTSGDLLIKATNSILISGTWPQHTGASILSNSIYLDANAGNAGQIEIETHDLTILDGGSIQSVSGTGTSGKIDIKCSGDITLSGVDEFDRPSVITSKNRGILDKSGDGGNIFIEANNLYIKDGGSINSLTEGPGDAGKIIISTNESILDDHSCIDSSSYGSGDAGNIKISTNKILLTNYSMIISSAFMEGAAGNISILESERIILKNSLIFSYIQSLPLQM